MKRNEVALLIIVVGLVVLASYALLNALVGQAAMKPVLVKSIDPISAGIDNPPDPVVFNKDAINPAVAITIGDQANKQPFTIGR